MKKNLQRIGLLLLAGLLYLGFYPIDLDPAARPSPPYPGMEGDFKVNSLLAATNIVTVAGVGPESIARDSLGNFYSGLDNGDIIRFDASGSNQVVKTIKKLCSRFVKRARSMGRSRSNIFGETISIFARRTHSPSLKPPARIFSNNAKFSSGDVSLYGLFLPGSVKVPRYSRAWSAVKKQT